MILNNVGVGRIAVVLAILVVPIEMTEVRAELPPGSYEKLRDEAQEAITAKVLSVKTAEPEAGKTDVVVVLEVKAVDRTKAGLKQGQQLTVKYVSIDPSKLKGFAGPRPLPILKNGETYPAFLNANKDEPWFEPAAYGESFTAMLEN